MHQLMTRPVLLSVILHDWLSVWVWSMRTTWWPYYRGFIELSKLKKSCSVAIVISTGPLVAVMFTTNWSADNTVSWQSVTLEQATCRLVLWRYNTSSDHLTCYLWQATGSHHDNCIYQLMTTHHADMHVLLLVSLDSMRTTYRASWSYHH